MIVRNATPSDIAAWLPLRAALWPHSSEQEHRDEMEVLLESDGTILLAIDATGSVLGFAELSLRRDPVEGAVGPVVPYLEGWFVIPEARSRGIGRTLIAAAEDWAVTKGFSEIASDVLIENSGSIAAHSKLGFEEAGRSVHFIKQLRRHGETQDPSTRS